VGALLIREIYTRYGREGLGFAWIIGEPLIFAVPVLIVWTIVRNPFEHGIPLLPFLWCGYLPILLFRHLGARMMFFVRANSGLLYHRQVTIFDLFLGRALLEIGSNIAAAAASFTFFYLVGMLDMPRNPGMLYLGYFFYVWWCAASGLIIGAASERSEWVEKVWSPISYLYIFYSGFFMMAAWLPPSIRYWALLQPYWQAYEMIRAGMLGNAVRTYYDPGYTAFVLTILTLIGLLLMRDARKYVILE
jgi:capsular polysaccharide transport system permease protein